MFDATAQRRDEDRTMSAPSQQIADIFAQHADFVWRSLRRLGVQTADVDDAVQEVFLVVYRRAADYEDRGLVRAWLFSISRQVASHYHRAASRTENRHRRFVADASSPDLEDLMARREAGRLVTAFLEELDEPQRMVFYLSDIEGMTAPEIAAALGANLNTVYGRLRLARKRFERACAQHAQGETTER